MLGLPGAMANHRAKPGAHGAAAPHLGPALRLVVRPGSPEHWWWLYKQEAVGAGGGGPERESDLLDMQWEEGLPAVDTAAFGVAQLWR